MVVASAGNGITGTHCGTDGNGYMYPASYDSVLSVTSVGSRYDIGSTYSPYWHRSWKDCHSFYPPYPEYGSHTHNDKVDVCAPGQLVMMAEDDYASHPLGYRVGIGTSASAPIVSGLAALIFAINPNLTAYEVKDIIKNTADDIYSIPQNQSYIGQLGTGRINAFRAVKTAQCMLNPIPGLDLAMQNSDLDNFVEPDTNTEIQWLSDDIWVRNQNDGSYIDTHQNPIYNAVSPSFVYVRVTNNSCETSSGTDDLKLYWAKASTALYWPDHWNGTLYMPDPSNPNPVLAGDEIGTLDIPVLGPGESKILEFQWLVPNPQDYVGINPNPWHFCLLARIDSPNDPMTFPEGMIITENVKNNNNIVWKNMTVIEMVPNITSEIGGVVAVGNPYASNHTFDLQFKKGDAELGKPIYEEAEVSIEMDNILYDAWVRGGNSATYVDSTNVPNKKIVATNNATLNNIQLYPNEIGTLYVSFNFLTNQLTAKNNFTFHVIQHDAATNAVIGGETYKVSKKPRPVFGADAGDDESIDRSESVTISAAQINEAAVYNWYDPNGNLIYTGPDLTVSPNVTQLYRLEIITDTDGYKDYDEVEVTVNPYKHLKA
ncbi:Calcium-dependent protease [Aequorivita lipolytica]|nr:Calcium-dependent protease [Aequorivita lipolytica]